MRLQRKFLAIFVALSAAIAADLQTAHAAPPKGVIQSFLVENVVPGKNKKKKPISCYFDPATQKWIPGRIWSSKGQSGFYSFAAELKNIKAALKKKSSASLRKKEIKAKAAVADSKRSCNSAVLPTPTPTPEVATPTPTPTASPIPTETPSPTPTATPDLFAEAGTLSADDVKYVYDKAALGAYTTEAIAVGSTQGAGALVDYMFSEMPEDPDFETTAADYLNDTFGDGVTQGSITMRGLQLWSTYLMLNTKNPAATRFSLVFLHNLMATGADPLSGSQRYLMYNHLNYLRTHLSDYRASLLWLGRDPAMSVFLNNNYNTKYTPNQNYARELLELFSLGVINKDGESHYTENDVYEGARVFTGWTLQEQPSGSGNWSMVFVFGYHDYAPKTFFAGSPYELTIGAEDPLQVPTDDAQLVNHILDNHPGAPYFLANRMLKEYLTENPPAALVEEMAVRIKALNYDLKAALMLLLKSEVFYKPEYRRTIQAGPFERIVGFLRKTGMPYDIYTLIPTQTDQGLRGAGQYLGNHPNPFGFNNTDFAGGPQSLSLIRLFENLVRNDTLFNSKGWKYDSIMPSLPADQNPLLYRSAEQVVDHVASLLNVKLTAAQRAEAVEFMNYKAVAGTMGRPFDLQLDPWNPDITLNYAEIRQKMAGLVEIMFVNHGLR